MPDDGRHFIGRHIDDQIDDLIQPGTPDTPSSPSYPQPTLADDTLSVNENVATSTSVGTIGAATGGTAPYTYALLGTGYPFTINSSTGEVLTNDTIDYETVSQYLITMQVTDDNAQTDTATLTINVNDLVEGYHPSDDGIQIVWDPHNHAATSAGDFVTVDNVGTLGNGASNEHRLRQWTTNGVPSEVTISSVTWMDFNDAEVMRGPTPAEMGIDENDEQSIFILMAFKANATEAVNDRIFALYNTTTSRDLNARVFNGEVFLDDDLSAGIKVTTGTSAIRLEMKKEGVNGSISFDEGTATTSTDFAAAIIPTGALDDRSITIGNEVDDDTCSDASDISIGLTILWHQSSGAFSTSVIAALHDYLTEWMAGTLVENAAGLFVDQYAGDGTPGGQSDHTTGGGGGSPPTLDNPISDQAITGSSTFQHAADVFGGTVTSKTATHVKTETNYVLYSTPSDTDNSGNAKGYMGGNGSGVFSIVDAGDGLTSAGYGSQVPDNLVYRLDTTAVPLDQESYVVLAGAVPATIDGATTDEITLYCLARVLQFPVPLPETECLIGLSGAQNGVQEFNSVGFEEVSISKTGGLNPSTRQFAFSAPGGYIIEIAIPSAIAAPGAPTINPQAAASLDGIIPTDGATATETQLGALPTWLSYDEGTRTFTYSVPANKISNETIRLTAANADGSVYDEFVFDCQAIPTITPAAFSIDDDAATGATVGSVVVNGDPSYTLAFDPVSSDFEFSGDTIITSGALTAGTYNLTAKGTNALGTGAGAAITITVNVASESPADELFVGPTAASDGDLTDGNCIFCALSGSDAAAGTSAAPKLTPSAAIAAAVSGGKTYVAFKAGDYFRLTSTVALTATHNGLILRSYGTNADTANKAIITGGTSLSVWAQSATLGPGYYQCTTYTPRNKACFSLSIDGEERAMAVKYNSYNEWSGVDGWANGKHDARQGIVGLRKQTISGESATRGTFDGRLSQTMTDADINVDGLDQDLVSLASIKRDLTSILTNGYWAGMETIDASTYSEANQEFQFIGTYPVMFTWSSSNYRREAFRNGGAHGFLVGNYNWLTDSDVPDGSYAWDPTTGAIVVKWSAGQTDLESRIVETSTLNDDLFTVTNCTASFWDLIFEHTEMHGYSISSGGTYHNDFAGTTTRKTNMAINCSGTNGSGQILRCVFRNMPQGISFSGSASAKDAVSYCLFRDIEFEGVGLSSSVAGQEIHHNEFVWGGVCFNRIHIWIRDGTSNDNCHIHHNHFHPCPGYVMLGNSSSSDGNLFEYNWVEKCGRYLHDGGTFYHVNGSATTPVAGYRYWAYRNYWDNCIGEAEFEDDGAIVTPISKWIIDNHPFYNDNNAGYIWATENVFEGHSDHAARWNVFSVEEDSYGNKFTDNLVVTIAPPGELSKAYSGLGVLRFGKVFQVDVESNFFILTEADQTGALTFVEGTEPVNGTRRNNAVCKIEQPNTWDGETHIDDLGDIWVTADTIGPIKTGCACFSSPVNMSTIFQSGGAAWDIKANAGFG